MRLFCLVLSTFVGECQKEHRMKSQWRKHLCTHVDPNACRFLTPQVKQSNPESLQPSTKGMLHILELRRNQSLESLIGHSTSSSIVEINQSTLLLHE